MILNITIATFLHFLKPSFYWTAYFIDLWTEIRKRRHNLKNSSSRFLQVLIGQSNCYRHFDGVDLFVCGTRLKTIIHAQQVSPTVTSWIIGSKSSHLNDWQECLAKLYKLFIVRDVISVGTSWKSPLTNCLRCQLFLAMLSVTFICLRRYPSNQVWNLCGHTNIKGKQHIFKGSVRQFGNGKFI